MAQRWGLGVQKLGNLTRFFTFSVVHLINYCTNVAIVVYVATFMKEEWGKQGYVFLLGSAHLIVGIYCVRLAWADKDVWRVSRSLFGILGHVVFSLVLGLTQLIQLKTAWGKYARRQQVQDDRDESGSEDEADADVEGAAAGRERSRRDLEAQHDRMLENVVPWTFPSKCFEGMFEGTVFALVLLYAVLKIGWKEDPWINAKFCFEDHRWWYMTLVVSGVLSFFTVSVSMLNFDYHLSSSVQKTVDHSIRYTFFHAVFRGCETGTRIMQIILWCLAFRSCTNNLQRAIPYFFITADYVLGVVSLLLLSKAEEQQYASLRTTSGMIKRIACSCLIGFLMLIANLSEFVDGAERGALKTAASKFSLAVRLFRLAELVFLTVFLLLGYYCHIVFADYADGHPGGEEEYGIFGFLLFRHKAIFVAFVFATVVYYFLLLIGFNKMALQSSEELVATRMGSFSGRVLHLPQCTSLLAADEPNASAAATPNATDPLGDRAAPLLDESLAAGQPRRQVSVEVLEGPGGSPVASSSGVAGRRNRQVPIISARDSDMPDALRPVDLQQRTDSWYHNNTPSFQVKRAPSLSFLLLSRGLHGTVRDMVLTSIDEDSEATMQGDVVVSGQRIQMSDFEVVKNLGAGAYGSVFQVRKISNNEVFAMKKLVKQNYVKRTAVESELPRRERDTLFLSGRHPNVAFLECAFDAETYWVLVTEFCNLGSLSKYIRTRAAVHHPGLDAAVAARISGQILQGLDHIHAAEIMHRDIKPDNVGISSSDDGPVAKLIDFGFAKRADTRQSRTIVGSYGYCAPEIDHARQLFGALQQAATAYDERVDLYSFGIVVFVMLIGREAGENSNTWNHRQFRRMLSEPDNELWRCARYQRLGITGAGSFQMLSECGALRTIRELTASQPADRPRTAMLAGRLPLFRRHPGSVPPEWEVPSDPDDAASSVAATAETPPDSWDAPSEVELRR